MGVEPFIVVRYLLLAAIAIPDLVRHPDNLRLSLRDFVFLLLIATLIGFMTYIGFSSFNYIPPLDASAIYNTHPAVMAVIASIFLKEKCSFFQTVVILFILLAVFLICQPEFAFGIISDVTPMDRLIGTLLAFSCGVCVTLAHALIRYVKHLPLSVVSFAQGVLITLVYLLIFRENIRTPTTSAAIFSLVYCSVTGAAGRLFSAAALQHEAATVVSAIFPFELLVVAVLQIFVLGIIPNALTLVGAFLLVTCIILLSFKKQIEARLTLLCGKSTVDEENLLIEQNSRC